MTNNTSGLNNTRVIVHYSQNAFYDALQEAVCSAKNEVMFIHLDPFVATAKEKSDDGRANYFDAAHEYVRTHSIKMRRIISIPNKKKLDWTINLIEKTKNIDTLDLAYIRINDIESCFPETVISCDIIDDHRLFLLNPLLNHIPHGKPFGGIVDIDNVEVAKVYREYFERLWNKITDDACDFGCWLKKGRSSYIDENLDMILRGIKD